LGKITKELSFDHGENDRLIRSEIESCEQMGL
jgi:hypothetical protein